MNLRECMEYLAERRTDELVITSAGSSHHVWQSVSSDDRTFHLTASMSMASMFAAGLAAGIPSTDVWVFMGDGSLAMNPGALIVERDMNLPNLRHFVIANRVYGSTANSPLPGGERTDFGAMARAVGIERVFVARQVADLAQIHQEISRPGYAFTVLEVDRFERPRRDAGAGREPEAVEAKYRFGRAIEQTTGIRIFRAESGGE